MDSKSDVRDFFVTRRAKISPEQANLPSHGTRRGCDGRKLLPSPE
jgi:hypothetical protein